MSKVYTEKVAKAQSLAEGLKRNFDKVTELGITDAQIETLVKVAGETAEMSAELDDLRELVKGKASAANAKLNELNELLREAKQVIKSNFEQISWSKFGIEDKR